MTALVIAVDGGQSSTLALAVETSGRVVGVGRAGASNHIHEPGGIERLTRALRESITGALTHHSPDDVVHACLGMTGGPTAAGDIAALLLPRSQIAAYKDTETALAGASAGANTGVIVIAGTGAAAYGRLRDGRSALADGWGYLMGDEGSAYDIGVAAFKAATRAADNRGAPTILLERIPAHFNLPDLRAVHRAVYSHQIDRPFIASLAAVVGAAAAAGDSEAAAILGAAGSALGRSAAAVIAHLGMLEQGLPIYCTGGVFAAGEFVLSNFRAMIERESPRSPVHEARYAPVIGGLLLALQAVGVQLTDQILATIDATMPADAIRKQAINEGRL